MISYEKKHRADIQVTLLGNDFSNRNFEKGYLKVAETDFGAKKFQELNCFICICNVLPVESICLYKIFMKNSVRYSL